jgi:hypothetical protein
MLKISRAISLGRTFPAATCWYHPPTTVFVETNGVLASDNNVNLSFWLPAYDITILDVREKMEPRTT